MAHLRSLPLTSLRWQEALNRHDQTQLKQLIQARFAHQHNATVHHFLPRLFGLLAGVIVKFCVWPVRRQSCLTDRSRVRRP
ncbi:Thermostable hemolysin [Vreelandella aquamarina]|uniref:Thermostable hemolysin n=1 Tax=Vreelandella aquamarina TaxID=77097 RepID=A0A1H8KVX6_9GAMM|nr:Thermostable hemolysin [Halomonas aquamarina]